MQFLSTKEKWALARIIYEARKREAWGEYAEILIKREPWQSHAQHPLVAEDHLLALAQIEALLRDHTIIPTNYALGNMNDSSDHR